VVDTANIPAGGLLHLLQCGADFSIQFRSDELMGNQSHISEEALATLACARVGSHRGKVLIGGLGMGFTLRAALAAWDENAVIIVAELVPEIVDWAQGPLEHLFAGALEDKRSSVAVTDVHDLIVGSTDRFDAILLDVDNGPDGFIRPENDRLYCDWGLRAAHRALQPGGVLAVWSAYPVPAFAAQLVRIGFAVEEVQVANPGGRGARSHTIWFATKDDLVSGSAGFLQGMLTVSNSSAALR
jgi:spermidine synthase